MELELSKAKVEAAKAVKIEEERAKVVKKKIQTDQRRGKDDFRLEKMRLKHLLAMAQIARNSQVATPIAAWPSTSTSSDFNFDAETPSNSHTPIDRMGGAIVNTSFDFPATHESKDFYSTIENTFLPDISPEVDSWELCIQLAI